MTEKPGFTLIELILVVALILTIGAMVAPFAGGFLIRVYHETTVNNLVSALHRAQSLSLDGKANATWSICHTGTYVRVYTDNCTSPSRKEDTMIPESVTVSGLTDTSFSRTTGEPSSPLTLTINSGAGSSTITMNAIGVVDVD